MTKDLMSQLSGNSLAISDERRKRLLAITGKMAGGGTYRRISIKGSKFRQMVGGEQVAVSKSDTMNVIILNSSPLSRMYYEGSYDPKGKGQAPKCWSYDSNTKKPSDDVPENQRQSTDCNTCPKNVKGSGQGESRACRFSQRLAVLIEGDWETVYQLSIPATSIFGEGNGGNLPLGAYAKLLSTNNMPVAAVVTELRFDENSETPKLFFKPVRLLEDSELDIVEPLTERDDTIDAITMKVSEVDGIPDTPEPTATATAKTTKKAKPATKKPPVVIDEEEDVEDEEEETVEEPVRKEKPKPEDDEDGDSELDSLLDQWDDEEED